MNEKEIAGRLDAIHCMTCAAVEPPYGDCTCVQGNVCRQGIDLIERLIAERDVARNALLKIQEWDCLNPPRSDLLCDLPWLRDVVDTAMSQQEEG